MDTNATLVVDFHDPDLLERVLEEFLRFGACPIDGQPFPGLLKMVTVVLRLPDGSEASWEAQVVLQMGPDRYVVQFLGPVDVARLRTLIQVARRASRVTGISREVEDRPFEGAPVPRRRDRHLPKPDRATVSPVQSPARPQNPPPRIVRVPKK